MYPGSQGTHTKKEGVWDQLGDMLLRGQLRWEVTLIAGFGNTEATAYPDTSGFSVVVGEGGILLQKEAEEKTLYLAREVCSSQLLKNNIRAIMFV